MANDKLKGFIFQAKIENDQVVLSASKEQDGSYLDNLPEAFVKMDTIMQKGVITLPASKENIKLVEDFIKEYDKL